MHSQVTIPQYRILDFTFFYKHIAIKVFKLKVKIAQFFNYKLNFSSRSLKCLDAFEKRSHETTNIV